MMNLSGETNPRYQETDTIEIQGEKFITEGSPPAVNYVGVVVPASTRISSVEGTTIRFHNRTGVKVDIWHARPWYKDDAHSSTKGAIKLDSHTPYIGIEADEIVTLTVDATRATPPLGEDDDRDRQFRVFVHGINEFAIGDSPPRMKLDP